MHIATSSRSLTGILLQRTINIKIVSLATRFLPAYLLTLDKFAEQNYFAQAAPDRCPDGHEYFWNTETVRKALVVQLGFATWPPTNATDMPDEQVIEYVEAFFQLVAKPSDSWFHSYCGSEHPKAFDISSGRYDYTVQVNTLFDRFGAGLRLMNGKVNSLGSGVLAPRLAEALPFGEDEHLRSLVTMALADFRSPDPMKRWTALQHIADAFERIKSSQLPNNKKQSVVALVKALQPEFALAKHIDALFREMTSLSNNLTIRHHEIGTMEITDDAQLIDFLFYSYYNLVRFALIRLRAVQSEMGDDPVRKGVNGD